MPWRQRRRMAAQIEAAKRRGVAMACGLARSAWQRRASQPRDGGVTAAVAAAALQQRRSAAAARNAQGVAWRCQQQQAVSRAACGQRRSCSWRVLASRRFMRRGCRGVRRRRRLARRQRRRSRSENGGGGSPPNLAVGGERRRTSLERLSGVVRYPKRCGEGTRSIEAKTSKCWWKASAHRDIYTLDLYSG